MDILIISFLLIISLGFGIYGAFNDFRFLKIPNFVPLTVMSLFGLAVLADFAFGGLEYFTPILHNFIAGGIVLVITFVLFWLKIFGAGDSKLLAVFALWTGLPGLQPLLFWMAVSGGLLGLSALYIKKAKPFQHPPEDGWICRLQQGESNLPYGIAIMGGAVVAASQSDIWHTLIKAQAF